MTAPFIDDMDLLNELPTRLIEPRRWQVHHSSERASVVDALPHLLAALVKGVLPPEGSPLETSLRWDLHADSLAAFYAFFLMRPLQPELNRQAYRAFLEAWLAQGETLFGLELSVASVEVSHSHPLIAHLAPEAFHEVFFHPFPKGGYGYVRMIHLHGDTCEVTLVGEASRFELPPTLDASVRTYQIPDDRALLSELLALEKAQGPAPYEAAKDLERFKALVEETPLSPAQAVLLYTGFPNQNAFGSGDPFGKVLLKTLGLKAKEAKEAFTQLNEGLLSEEAFFKLVLALGRNEAQGPASDSRYLKGMREQLLKAWSKKKIQHPKALLDRIAKAAGPFNPPASYLNILFSDSDPFWDTFLPPFKHSHKELSGRKVCFYRLRHWTSLFLSIVHSRPVGERYYEGMQRAYQHLKGVLLQPDAWLTYASVPPEHTPAFRADLARLVSYTEELHDNEIGVFHWHEGPGLRISDYPGKEHYSGLLIHVEVAFFLQHHPLSKVERSDLFDTNSNIGYNSVWLNPAIYQLGDSLSHPAVGLGDYTFNPLLTAPHLVTALAQAQGLSEDAAALYLIYLTHPDPLMSLLKDVFKWDKARLELAHQEGVVKGKLVEGVRSRSKRSYFLPGAWDAKTLRSETWKAPFYLSFQEEESICISSFPAAFEQAFARLQAGDIPG